MITTIAKRFTFDAAHCVPTMPDGHKCRRQHGHTYEVELVLRGHVQPSGLLVDYGDIAEAWKPINDTLDHRNLNDIPGLEVPTTENLVAWIFGWFYGRWGSEIVNAPSQDPNGGGLRLTNEERLVWNHLQAVRIKESSTTWCEMSKVEFLAFCGNHA